MFDSKEVKNSATFFFCELLSRASGILLKASSTSALIYIIKLNDDPNDP